MKLATVVRKATEVSIVRLKADVVGALTKWILSLGATTYVDEFLQFHAEEVDPTQLTCSHGFFNEVASIPKNYPLTKLALTMAQYNPDVVLSQSRPLPDLCKFIVHAEIQALIRDEAKLQSMEHILAETRKICQGPLQERIGAKRTATMLRKFAIQVARLALSKSMAKTFPPGVSGKMTPEKLVTMRSHWICFLQTHEPLKDIGMVTGLLEEVPEEEVVTRVSVLFCSELYPQWSVLCVCVCLCLTFVCVSVLEPSLSGRCFGLTVVCVW